MDCFKNQLGVLVLLAAFFFVSELFADSPSDILVVVNKSLPAKELDRDTVLQVFLGDLTHYDGKRKLVVVNAREGSKLRRTFQKRVLSMEPDEEKKYWMKQKIRYGRRPPVEFSVPLRAVFSLRNSVGYVFRKDFKEGTANVVSVLPAQP